jgi:hypothetical protein
VPLYSSGDLSNSCSNVAPSTIYASRLGTGLCHMQALFICPFKEKAIRLTRTFRSGPLCSIADAA